MFTTNHFIWLGICAAFIVCLLFVSLKFKFSMKTSIYVMGAISLASEIVKTFIHFIWLKDGDQSMGMVLKPTSLPFHLCSLLIFVMFYLVFSKNEKRNQKLIDFYVPAALLGGIIALLMATCGVEFTEVQPYQSFLYHAGLIWFALYALITKQVNMGWKNYLKTCAILLCLVFSMIWVNSALSQYETNFFFIVYPPAPNLPLLNMNHGWFAYFLSLLLVSGVCVTLLYAPYMIIEAVKKGKEKKLALQTATTADESVPVIEKIEEVQEEVKETTEEAKEKKTEEVQEEVQEEKADKVAQEEKPEEPKQKTQKATPKKKATTSNSKSKTATKAKASTKPATKKPAEKTNAKSATKSAKKTVAKTGAKTTKPKAEKTAQEKPKTTPKKISKK